MTAIATSALDQAVADLEQTLLSKSEGKSGATAPVEGEGRAHVAGLLETIAKGLKDAVSLFKSTNPSKDEGKGSGNGPANVGGEGGESGTTEHDKSNKGGDLLVSGKGESKDAPGSGDGKKKKPADLPEEKEHGGDDKTKGEQSSGREPGDPDAGHKTVGKSERELLELPEGSVLEPLSREDMVSMLAEALGKSEAEVAGLRADVRSLSETIVAVLAPMASATALIVKSLGGGSKVEIEKPLPAPGVIGTPPKKDQPIAGLAKSEKPGTVGSAGSGDAAALEGMPLDDSRNSVLARLTKAVQDEKLPPSILGRFDARGVHALVGIEQDILKSYALPQPAAQ